MGEVDGYGEIGGERLTKVRVGQTALRLCFGSCDLVRFLDGVLDEELLCDC